MQIVSVRKLRISVVTSAVLIFTVLAGTVHSCEGLEGHIEYIAEELCAIASSVKLLSYAVIGLFVVNAVSLILSFVKKSK